MIKKFFMSRFFLGFVGIVCLGIFIWFLGDLFAFGEFRPFASPWARGIFILSLVLCWLGWLLWRAHSARQKNESLITGMSRSVDAGGPDELTVRSRDEVAQLKLAFEKSAATLKTTRFGKQGGGSGYLYELPWYAFIGAPGSGKTTALANSGLRFPLAEAGKAQAVRGVGGTRNCDWWFTDEAVLLDTAGRYTTHESESKVDQAAWLGFLRLLKKTRSRQPLNGLLVTVSAQDLLTHGRDRRVAYAATIRSRIAELYEQLGVRIPVYLIVTKTDLLSGFSEFFANMGREEREQVWGATLSVDLSDTEGTDFVGALNGELGTLAATLDRHAIGLLNSERDAERRLAIFGFPEQFAVLAALVAEFISETFIKSKFTQQPMLRGVYFSSGTQEGTPIDRVLNNLSKKLGIEQPAVSQKKGGGKSYFLTRLLRNVIFNEAGLAGLNRRAQARYKALLRFTIVAMILLVTASLSAWAWSFWNNRALIAETKAKTTALAGKIKEVGDGYDDPTLLALLGALDDLRALPYGEGEPNRNVPFSAGLGLSQAAKIGEMSRDRYRHVLSSGLLPRIAFRLETELRGADNPVAQYEILKMYLMMFDDAHLDAKAFAAGVLATIEGGMLPRDWAKIKDSANIHLGAAMQRRPWRLPIVANAELIASVRTRLADVPLTDRIYGRIKLLGLGGDLPGFRIADVAGPSAGSVLVRASGKLLTDPIPALYTYEGYYKSFLVEAERAVKQLAAEEAWVLGKTGARGKAAEPKQVLEEVKRRYMVEYIKVWDEFLADLRLKRAANMSETLVMLHTLGNADSPLKKLMQAVVKETALTAVSDKGIVSAKAEDVLKDNARTLIGRTMVGQTALSLTKLPTAATRAEMVVDEHYDELRRYVGTGAPGQPARIDQALSALSDAYKELSAAGVGASGAMPAGAMPSSLVRLKVEADSAPTGPQAVLRALVGGATGQAAAATKDALKGAMGTAKVNCEKTVSGRYPLGRNNKNEIAIDDFNRVFSPGGDLDDFFVKNLQNQLDMSGPNWRARADDGSAPPAATIRSFQHASTIRNAFFRQGSRTASAVADVMLAGGDSNGLVFEYDGKATTLGSGGESAMRVEWPPRNPAPNARLYFSKTGQVISGEGLWALFRLFDRGQVEGASDRLRLSYTIDNKKVVLELRASSANNPFRLPALEAFQCPRM